MSIEILERLQCHWYPFQLQPQAQLTARASQRPRRPRRVPVQALHAVLLVHRPRRSTA